MKRPTKELLIEAGEELFARKGYTATSMEDIASCVGIRPSAIYKHFQGKEALYEAVLDKTIEPFFTLFANLSADASLLDMLEVVLRHHTQQPRLCQLVMHATLNGGEHHDLLVDKWYRPVWLLTQASVQQADILRDEEADRFDYHFMILNNLLLSYVPMAALHKDGLGLEPLSTNAIDQAGDLIMNYARGIIKPELLATMDQHASRVA